MAATSAALECFYKNHHDGQDQEHTNEGQRYRDEPITDKLAVIDRAAKNSRRMDGRAGHWRLAAQACRRLMPSRIRKEMASMVSPTAAAPA